MELDSDCETRTSVCSDVKEEHSVSIIRHEDKVGLHVCFTVWKLDTNFSIIYSLCISSQTATTVIPLERIWCSLPEDIIMHGTAKFISLNNSTVISLRQPKHCSISDRLKQKCIFGCCFSSNSMKQVIIFGYQKGKRSAFCFYEY